jgi:hypothetical protein
MLSERATQPRKSHKLRASTFEEALATTLDLRTPMSAGVSGVRPVDDQSAAEEADSKTTRAL